MKLPNPAGCPFPSGWGNVNNGLRPEKFQSSCFRTGVRLSPPPPKGYYTNLFTLSAALPSQYGSSNTDRKERIFSLVESVRSFFMSCGLSTDSPWTVCGQSADSLRTVTECSYFHLPFSKIFAIFNCGYWLSFGYRLPVPHGKLVTNRKMYSWVCRCRRGYASTAHRI